MPTKLMTFDEFRATHDDVLREQRQTLGDDARAQSVLTEASAAKGWAEWPSAAETRSGVGVW